MNIFRLTFISLLVLLLHGCFEKQSVYDVKWQDFDNNTLKLETFKNHWVIVNYWASWCRPCIEEMPLLQRYYERRKKDNVIVIGANVEYNDGFITEKAILAFAKKLGVTFPIVKANINLNQTSFGEIKALPQTVFINPKGKVIHTHVGKVTEELLNTYIKD